MIRLILDCFGGARRILSKSFNADPFIEKRWGRVVVRFDGEDAYETLYQKLNDAAVMAIVIKEFDLFQ